VPITNLANEQFVAETSKKTRKSIHYKQERGELVVNFAPYGYLKEQKTLIVDAKTAPVIALIFKMKIEGYSQDAIANHLNFQKILCPLEYKKANNLPVADGLKQRETAIWNGVTVRRILENEVYAGTLVLGKTESRDYKNKERRAKNPHRFRDNYQSIVSREDFEIVQELLKKDLRTPANAKTAYPLSGIVLCGNCGEKLYRINKKSRNNAYYVCQNKDCKHNVYINEKSLTNGVISALRLHISCIFETQKMLDELGKIDISAEQISTFDERIKTAESEIKLLENRRIKAFSSKVFTDIEREILLKDYDLRIAEQREFIKHL
jgi:hypothetical protein